MIYPIDPARTALLVIDVQKEYFREDGPAYVAAARSILPDILKLIEAARNRGALVVYIQHVSSADGSDIGRMDDFSDPEGPKSFVEGTPWVQLVEELAPARGEVVIQKRRYGSFTGTGLDGILKARGIDTVIICGYMTSFCCETTARDAHDLDYRVIFVSDANEGPDLIGPYEEAISHRKVLVSTIAALSAGFAEVIPTEEVCRRIG